MKSNKEVPEGNMMGEVFFPPPLVKAVQMRTVHNCRLITSQGCWQCGWISCMTGVVQLVGSMPFRKLRKVVLDRRVYRMYGALPLSR